MGDQHCRWVGGAREQARERGPQACPPSSLPLLLVRLPPLRYYAHNQFFVQDLCKRLFPKPRKAAALPSISNCCSPCLAGTAALPATHALPPLVLAIADAARPAGGRRPPAQHPLY